MEYCEKGSLFDVLRDKNINAEDLSWNQRWKFAEDAAKSIFYLHQQNIYHRDIKSLNFLVNSSGDVKVSDFGLSAIKPTSSSINFTASTNITSAGTLQWTAPELLKNWNTKFNSKCDVYSYAIVLWEIATRQKPYEDSSDVIIKINVTSGERLPIPDTVPQQFAQLITQCWDHDPKKRPDFSDIIHYISLNHPVQ